MNLYDHTKLADNIKYLRNIFGFTQTHIADQIHICRSTYALIETGRKEPSISTIMDLAKVYQLKPEIILNADTLRLLNNMVYAEECKGQVTKLIDIFCKLSPYTQGCLMERAEILLACETTDRMPNHEPIKKR